MDFAESIYAKVNELCLGDITHLTDVSSYCYPFSGEENEHPVEMGCLYKYRHNNSHRYFVYFNHPGPYGDLNNIDIEIVLDPERKRGEVVFFSCDTEMLSGFDLNENRTEHAERLDAFFCNWIDHVMAHDIRISPKSERFRYNVLSENNNPGLKLVSG